MQVLKIPTHRYIPIFFGHPHVQQQRPLVYTSAAGYTGSCLSLCIMELSNRKIPVTFPKIGIAQPTLHAEPCIQLLSLHKLWSA